MGRFVVQFAERVGFREREPLELQRLEREPAEQHQPGERLACALRQVFTVSHKKLEYLIFLLITRPFIFGWGRSCRIIGSSYTIGM